MVSLGRIASGRLVYHVGLAPYLGDEHGRYDDQRNTDYEADVVGTSPIVHEPSDHRSQKPGESEADAEKAEYLAHIRQAEDLTN